ncbi:MAG: AAA family ATPase [Candidatus Humimicrobiaceae bacterium]|jgi:Flp pilus assembly CpaE family ATPase|nr:AAA family ATPase [Actinomycetota bacterium]MDD5600634.1 AAA family ATPase [Actinomycetota bacterium]MDY0027957.1 AAA family ATPase [Candidatus Humimicrobiaceae bacterium]
MMETFINLENKNKNTVICKSPAGAEPKHVATKNIENQQNYTKKNIIITILSNKGGAGKTSIAITLALFLSQIAGNKTLLMELDSSPGDFGVLFDVEKDKSLELALRFPEKYNEFTKNICKNMDVLKGIPDPLLAENVKKGAVNNLIDYVSMDYEYTIVDTQTVINGLILDVLKISNEVFVISEYSVESIARVSNLIEILVKKFSINESKIKLIINKKKFIYFFKVFDISKVIKIPVYAFIRFDNKFNKSKFMFNKVNILNTNFFKDIGKISQMICEETRSNVKR